MSNTEKTAMGSWERIQGGVKETERLIGQKKYNTAMIKSRQTLEYMVKSLCDKSGLMESGLIDMIDALYDSKLISQTTCEHYHKIRTIGNKAIHEDDNSAYNANQAYHLLSQEVYTFANDYSDKKKRVSQVTSGIQLPESRERRQAPQRSVNSSSRRRRSSRSSGLSIDPGSLIKPLLLIAIIIVLVFIIKMLRPSKDQVAETTAPITTELSTELPTEETTPESTAAAIMYKTVDTVNVRSTPSTDLARIGLLGPDTQVEFVKDHDEKWCVIKYNGQDAYVVKEYLAPVQ